MSLQSLPRPFKPHTLPGGGVVHLRALTLAELRHIDRRAAEATDPVERMIRQPVLVCAYALANPDGSRMFPEVTDADLGAVENLTGEQIRSINEATGEDREDAKND